MIDTYKAMLTAYIETVVPSDAGTNEIVATKLAFLAGSYSVCRLIDSLVEGSKTNEELGKTLEDFREWLFNEVTLKGMRIK